MLHFTTSTCWICGEIAQGKFKDNSHICGKHRQDEIDFLGSLPDKKLTREQKEQRAIYRRRWQKKVTP